MKTSVLSQVGYIHEIFNRINRKPVAMITCLVPLKESHSCAVSLHRSFMLVMAIGRTFLPAIVRCIEVMRIHY